MMEDFYFYWVGPGLLSFPLNLNSPDIMDFHNAAKTKLLEDHGDYVSENT